MKRGQIFSVSLLELLPGCGVSTGSCGLLRPHQGPIHPGTSAGICARAAAAAGAEQRGSTVTRRVSSPCRHNLLPHSLFLPSLQAQYSHCPVLLQPSLEQELCSFSPLFPRWKHFLLLLLPKFLCSLPSFLPQPPPEPFPACSSSNPSANPASHPAPQPPTLLLSASHGSACHPVRLQPCHHLFTLSSTQFSPF